MGKSLNVQEKTIQLGSVATILNGDFSSLSGPVGFTPTQPVIRVSRITVVNPSSSGTVAFSLYKGASGGSANGTQVYTASVPPFGTVNAEVDILLESGEFLTGECISSGSLVVNVSAKIGF